ncbi:MAG: septum formation protein Maf [Kiritimatiellae bacterium]|nr:septum formation protein Maf [Kiritimatiellia bacterium]
MKNRPLILASASPRRKRLLEEMGFTFEVVAPEVTEVHYLDDLHGSVMENAAMKCEWCRARHPDATILAADTGIEFEGLTIMKPRSREEAASFLRMFSGKTHKVMTGVALAVPDGDTRLHVETSLVHFRELTEEIIDAYIEQVIPLDRAGAYDIDECGEMIVDHHEGSYTNIVGLPCEVVHEWLEAPAAYLRLT